MAAFEVDQKVILGMLRLIESRRFGRMLAAGGPGVGV
jgi:hypothetical protein